MRAFSIRSHLLLLVLAVSIPLAAAVGYGIYHDHEQAVASTKATLRILAQMMVTNTGERIAEARRTLESLAQRPFVRLVDPKRCDPALQELHALSPGYANIVYTDLAGVAVCSALPQPGGKPVNVGQTPWFRKFLQGQRFTVGQPHVGPISGKWVSVLSAPIRNERGELVGAIHMSLDLKAYDPNIPVQHLPPESRYGFIAEDGTMIWRNLDPEGVIGTRPNDEAVRRIVEVRDGEFESLAIDGVVRFFSVVPMPQTGWVAFVGVPAASVYAEARRDAMVLSFSALGVIVLIALLAVVIAGRIAGPVAALAETARAAHGGEPGLRAPVAGPREVAEVAREFNVMIDAQQRHQAQQQSLLEKSREVEEAVSQLNESLEQRVRERTAELEASNRELEAFSYSVSHDLRAPLRALDGFSYLLNEEYAERLGEAGQDYLRRIREASQRMGALIDDLIELARIGRQEMQRADLDLATLALEEAENLRELTPRRQVSWDIAPDLRAHADPVLARALMGNLLRNAWKFTSERELARIEIGCERANGEMVYFVRDNGVGFDPTYADKLFKPFQRLHDPKRFPGTGIGLATVMRVVRRHGGRIWAEGAPEQGATFRFTLS